MELMQKTFKRQVLVILQHFTIQIYFLTISQPAARPPRVGKINYMKQEENTVGDRRSMMPATFQT